MSDFNLFGPSCKVVGWFVKGDLKLNSWVARITGKSQVFSYAREDVPANGGISFQHKAGEIPQGEKRWYLPDGIYEFYLVTQNGTVRQEYGRVEQGKLLKMTKEQVVKWVQS